MFAFDLHWVTVKLKSEENTHVQLLSESDWSRSVEDEDEREFSMDNVFFSVLIEENFDWSISVRLNWTDEKVWHVSFSKWFFFGKNIDRRQVRNDLNTSISHWSTANLEYNRCDRSMDNNHIWSTVDFFPTLFDRSNSSDVVAGLDVFLGDHHRYLIMMDLEILHVQTINKFVVKDRVEDFAKREKYLKVNWIVFVWDSKIFLDVGRFQMVSIDDELK